MIKLTNVLLEFQEDLKKQCVVLMGLPASGKSTFINNDLTKYVPVRGDYKVSNSDSQVVALQYNLANKHFTYLKDNIKDENDLKQFIKDTEYKLNSDKIQAHPITYKWWIDNKDKIKLKQFYNMFRKDYYATYFDIRDLALIQNDKLLNIKIHKTSNLIIVDTTATNPDKLYSILRETKEEGFSNSIIYLDIDFNLSIERDVFRKKTQGRGVGEKVILRYVNKLKSANKVYNANKEELIDKLFHFQWEPSGDSPIKGTWKLINKKNFFLQRKLNKKKND